MRSIVRQRRAERARAEWNRRALRAAGLLDYDYNEDLRLIHAEARAEMEWFDRQPRAIRDRLNEHGR